MSIKKFYKVNEDGEPTLGSGIAVPAGCIEYTEGSEPQDLLDALALKTTNENAVAYKDARRAAYPSIGDQLDALFHAGAFPDDMAAEIQAVKDANPKPAE